MTPTQAIGRVLRELGLVQGVDFRVQGHREARNGLVSKRQRVGTLVCATHAADLVIADNAVRIMDETKALGFPFKVKITTTRSGHPVCAVFHTSI